MGADGDSKITDDSSTQQKIIAKAVDKLDDPATLMNVIAGAVDRRNLNYSDKQGEELLYLLDTDAPYTGWTKLMHKNGQVSTLAQIKNGKSDGPVVSWYENGKKEGKGYFENGFMEGVWTSWNKTGQKEQEGGYKNGLKDGRWMSWNADGKEEWNDKYNLYDTGVYYNGIFSDANAIIRFYQYDSSWFETTWKNGQKDGPTTVWTNYYHEYARGSTRMANMLNFSPRPLMQKLLINRLKMALLDFVLAYTSEERGREFGHGITHWKKEMLS